MRKAYLKLCKKLRYRWYFAYTWLHRSSLKHCGKGVRLEYPIRLEEPHRISIGDDVMTHPGSGSIPSSNGLEFSTTAKSS